MEEKIGKFLAILIAILIVAAVLGLGAFVWNLVMPLFGLPQLTTWEFVGLWFILNLLLPTGYRNRKKD